MKNNRLIFLLQVTAFVCAICTTTASCTYDDFVQEEFEFTAVYFPKPQIDRTFIIGEGMEIGVGAVLGGRLTNNQNVEVTYSLDENLVTDAGLTVLPESYYQLLDANGNPTDKITIPAGKVQGFVYVKADSINFLADPASLGNNYALGFRMESVTRADSILVDYQNTLITFSYINQLYGFYVQDGSYTKTTGQDTETTEYPAGISDAIELTMRGPNRLQVNGLADFRSGDDIMQITLATDNTISIQSIEGAREVTDDGGSYYDPSTKMIYLNYSFDFDGSSYTATDVLDYRNRVVDGVNQFED